MDGISFSLISHHLSQGKPPFTYTMKHESLRNLCCRIQEPLTSLPV